MMSVKQLQGSKGKRPQTTSQERMMQYRLQRRLQARDSIVCVPVFQLLPYRLPNHAKPVMAAGVAGALLPKAAPPAMAAGVRGAESPRDLPAMAAGVRGAAAPRDLPATPEGVRGALLPAPSGDGGIAGPDPRSLGSAGVCGTTIEAGAAGVIGTTWSGSVNRGAAAPAFAKAGGGVPRNDPEARGRIDAKAGVCGAAVP